MTVIYPEATPVLGNTKVKAVLTVADPENPSLAGEINHASSVDVSCFLRDFAPNISQTKGQAPKRLCTKQQLDQLGQVQPQGPQLRYVYAPQEADNTDNNKAKATLTEGTEVYLFERLGLDAREDDFTAAERVNIHHVRLGHQGRTRSGDGEFDEFEILQESVYIEPPFYDVVIDA